jgi:hypothetical protein
MMLHLTRQTVRLPGSPEQEELVLAFDQPAAQGTLILRECACGLELLCPDLSPYPLAVLDFWYAANAPDAAAPPVQIIVHSPAQTADPLGRVQFFSQRTQVDFERGVERLDRADGDFCYAYPLGDYPPVEQVVNHQGVQVFRALDSDGEPSATWYTTDPADAGAVAGGHQFDIREVILGLQAPGRRVPASAGRPSDPGRLRELLVSAIAAGIITRDGIVDWQSWPRCGSCGETIPPAEHPQVCIVCSTTTLCNSCASARARSPGC